MTRDSGSKRLEWIKDKFRETDKLTRQEQIDLGNAYLESSKKSQGKHRQK